MKPALLGFAEALDKLLREHNMSQAELARRLEVYSGDVSRWRHGGGISIHNVRRIADLFGVSRSDLEALAGYGPGSGPRRQPEPQLEAVVSRQARELAEDLRTVSPAMWPAVLHAQRAARRAAIDIARLRSADFAEQLAEGQATGRGRAAYRRRPYRFSRAASRRPDVTAEYIYQEGGLRTHRQIEYRQARLRPPRSRQGPCRQGVPAPSRACVVPSAGLHPAHRATLEDLARWDDV